MKILKKHITKATLITLLFISNFISAQEILQPTNEKTYSEYINKVLETVNLNDATQFKNGIHHEKSDLNRKERH